MPYDLYGNYYKSAREAEAAEMAQVNEIDNRINSQRLRQLEQRPDSNADIWQYINMLEDRITELEKYITKPI